ncbi:MAG TPA: DedA family protein [Myxococcaceae bacterium]|nr:DedA family protein [Myxococcaceae bacterium]
MEELLRSLVADAHGFVAYASVFGVLLACGLGVPLPEDISLILGGFLAHKGAASLPGMMAVGFFGILVGDSLIYLAGRRVGTGVRKGGGGFFARIVTPEKRAKVEQLFAAHGQKIVMIARFLPGVRAVTYFTAGSARMSYVRFIFWDGIAALASAPLFVYLGYKFGGQLELIIEKIKQGEMVVIGLIVTAVIGFVIYKRSRAVAERRAQAGTPQMASASEQTPTS